MNPSCDLLYNAHFMRINQPRTGSRTSSRQRDWLSAYRAYTCHDLGAVCRHGKGSLPIGPLLHFSGFTCRLLSEMSASRGLIRPRERRKWDKYKDRDAYGKAARIVRQRVAARFARDRDI